jgi:hypothetical protein
VPPVHAAPLLCQLPDALQFCGCDPVQWVWPGAQLPAHAPPTQVWLTHAEPLSCQLPPALQFWGRWPLHCVWPAPHW